VPDKTGFFATQAKVTRAALPYLGIEPGMRILEPSCGKGAIARVLREEYGQTIEIVGVEINKSRAKLAKAAVHHSLSKAQGGGFTTENLPVFTGVIQGDFLELSPNGLGQIDRCITNPWFEIWMKIAEHCFTFSHETTLLLPFNAAASKKRSSWWKEHPAHLRVLSKRPSFAISVKCTANNKKNRAAGVKHCDYQVLIALDAKPKKTCPSCGMPTETTSSDAQEYCWASWSPAITRGLWDVIDTPEDA
jgi:hypothetical protein